MIEQLHGTLASFLDFAPGHGAGAIENDRKIQRDSPMPLFMLGRGEVDFNDDFA
jgi:hypothetical protein